ncbi:hypothetical protein CgunFtcFv8_000252 [Champsocephalus gunnari]|uniref:Zinc finger CCCH-type with G patch domain-containing protein n=1 Tax=Champsocephalus gunnari TaxID=52237 RepID=A0AAN8DLQ4_CHAGU|nr:hypothetical protein CgunFtcFv8_000252 [Champsocephalus gunnari]
MDEGTLEAAISAYGAQLQQVDTALSAGLDPSQQSDLLQLKEDLSQLIELTESSLVSVKKSKLLASLEDIYGFQANTSTAAAGTNGAHGSLNDEFAAFYTELGGSSEHRTGHHGGTLEYHNAMVVGAEPADGEEAQVRVFYVYPTQKSMKPCPYYLEDKCRFPDTCRFSHGEVVYVSELREFLEFDLSNLEAGSSCLARHEDGLWYPAKIKELDSGFFTVKFDSVLLKDVVVEADCIIPPLREDDLPSSSDSDDSGDEDEDDVVFAKVMDSAVDATDILRSADFGGWEAHTKGIGSKLMLKMGYEYGKGLGKAQDGRLEPVMAVVVPKGKPLDECPELTPRRPRMKSAKDGKGTGRPKRKPRRRRPRGGATGGRKNVFDFLNNKLGGKSIGPAEGGAAAAGVATGVEAYMGGKSIKRTLNVKVFQAAERVSQTEREIQKLTQTLKRQTGRDASRVKQLEEKLSAARRLLAQQKAQELSVQGEHRKSDTHKKMTEF